MELTLQHPEKTEKMQFTADNLDIGELETTYKPIISSSKLKSRIDKLKISAEGKLYLLSIAEVSLRIGDTILSIGRKTVELIIHFCKTYPNTAVGLVVGATAGLIISSIPVIGWLLGWLVMPLLAVLGIGVGFWMDWKEKNVKASIKNDAMELFGTLKNLKHASI
jgi:hypothetical protein